MATKNPRVSVMLTPASNEILNRLCAVSGQSKSGLIAEFLEDTCMPMFERMAVVMEAAVNATDGAKAAAKQGFQDAEDKLLSIAGMTTDLFDAASRPILEESERITRRGRKVDRHGRTDAPAPARPEPGELAAPPHVTRGSGTPNTVARASKSPMKPGSNDKADQESNLKPPKRPAKAFKTKVGG